MEMSGRFHLHSLIKIKIRILVTLLITLRVTILITEKQLQCILSMRKLNKAVKVKVADIFMSFPTFITFSVCVCYLNRFFSHDSF